MQNIKTEGILSSLFLLCTHLSSGLEVWCVNSGFFFFFLFTPVLGHMLCDGLSVVLLESLIGNVFHKINGMQMDDSHAVT